ncbi:SDR family NAD(P)-dependent oxidoreductase [Actinoalloteichus caeruleus]|uniref:Short-chain dehydrogenase n=1 Tax=Actinoalloteichus caeruleus DSM 43889 TaxID=1120930 RepID=A0ABT1JQ35_ACTCY|nr:SDR family NAD(P)-dependent oxidoreductase [Actinoalloteichus caeruleus]MCP2334289.1 Short-chain dehydrogenase [Actinoalloteichus caeruleus DSM 43889]
MLPSSPRRSPRDIPNLRGRTAVVTGATSGLGHVMARVLAERGAHVVLAVRDLARGRAASAELVGDTEVRQLDLGDLASVRSFAAALAADHHGVDLLVNNAGVGFAGAPPTVEGFEGALGVNHLGHFVLTGLLMPVLERGSGSRVLTVASDFARYGRLDPDRLDTHLSPARAYARSKLANVLFGAELDRLLRDGGSPVRSVLAHPGMTRTPIHGRVTSVVARLAFATPAQLFGRSVEEGARPLLHAAVGPEPEPDVMTGPGAGRRPPSATPLTGRLADRELAARLWAASERLTGVSYPRAVAAPDRGAGRRDDR